MKHIGNISQVHGWDLEPVDIIVGGSPCQDLSVAGKRKGLLHTDKGDDETTRSGLFHEQIRIIKEMRDYEANVRKRPTELVRPRFCIWENVPGAFSSNKGEDFRTVLEEFGKIKDPSFSIPRPKDGKWEPAGLIVGNGFNIAWRTHSAEFWCVPQRRKRISVVIDFGSERTGEISFERKSMLGNSEQSKQKRKEAATEATDGIGTASESYTLKIRGGAATDSNGRSAGKGPLVQHELSGTLGVSQDQTLFQFGKAYGFFPQMKAEGMNFSEEISGCIVVGTNPEHCRKT